MTDITPDEIHYCQVHPDIETELRCNKCERYMCARCAVSTPVGYRCRECVRQVENKFFSATSNDLLITFAVSTGLCAVGGLVASLSNFILLNFFIGIFWAGLVSEAVLRATKRRRGRNSGEIAVGGVIFGAIIGAGLHAVLIYNDRYGRIIEAAREANIDLSTLPREIYVPMGDFIFSNIFSIGLLIFVGITAVTVYTRMKS
ncbi:MAG: hypothetical protein KJ043_19380 [Anaerolineae bacterium]|nr:hypothetical protein [Anaerolineae bacterium]